MAVRLGRKARAVALACALVGTVVVSGGRADAWKPATHEQAAFEAYDDAVDDGFVTVAGVQVPVDPELLDALRQYPESYRAGVLGPDAYPDIYVGQAMIHPDTVTDNDRLPPDPIRRSVTDDWLREVWRQSLLEPPGPERLKVRAFAAGFLTHAAGDVWGHTFVNEFAKGVFPSITDVAEAPIAIRHVVVEGYVDHLRPVPAHDPARIADIDPPDAFITRVFITSDFARTHSDPVHFNLFLARRAQLQSRVDADRALGASNPVARWLLGARVSADLASIAEIDRGLAAWPAFSTRVAKALLAADADFPAARDAAVEAGLSTVLPMLGVPRLFGQWAIAYRNFVRQLKVRLGAIVQPFVDWIDGIVDQGIDLVLRNFIDISQLPAPMKAVVDTNGDGRLSLAELRGLSKVELLVNTPAVLDPADKARLDAAIGVGGDRTLFDTGSFAAFHDTSVMSRLILLNGDGLNELTAALGVPGELYAAASPADDNVMLGWIRSIDGEYQWRANSLRAGDPRRFGTGTMPLWEDCQARDRVFRRIFAEPLPGAFADAGDECSPLAA